NLLFTFPPTSFDHSSQSARDPHPPLPSNLLRTNHYPLLTTHLPITPLAATLMNLPISVANKGLTASLNPLDATLTRNQGDRPSAGHLSLFSSPLRIQVRMSASISCLTPQRSSFFGTSATPGPTLFFSTLM